MADVATGVALAEVLGGFFRSGQVGLIPGVYYIPNVLQSNRIRKPHQLGACDRNPSIFTRPLSSVANVTAPLSDRVRDQLETERFAGRRIHIGRENSIQLLMAVKPK